MHNCRNPYNKLDPHINLFPYIKLNPYINLIHTLIWIHSLTIKDVLVIQLLVYLEVSYQSTFCAISKSAHQVRLANKIMQIG